MREFRLTSKPKIRRGGKLLSWGSRIGVDAGTVLGDLGVVMRFYCKDDMNDRDYFLQLTPEAAQTLALKLLAKVSVIKVKLGKA